MKLKLTLAATALVALAACETPAPGVTISPDAMARSASITADTVAPAVSPRTAISTFDQYCGRFPANPNGTRRAVQADGYFLLGSVSSDGLEMWASDDGRPLVATGRRDGAEVCMVMIKEGASLDSAVAAYVGQKHGGAATSMGSIQMGAQQAENVWIVPSNPPVIYFTLVQSQPGLGRVEAFATVTE